METMVNGIEEDFLSPPFKWKKNIKVPKKIGFLKEFDLIEGSVANNRATDVARKILEKNGIEVIEFDLNDIFQELFIATMASYMNTPILKSLIHNKISNLNEPVVRDFREIMKLAKIPQFLTRPLIYILNAFNFKRVSIFVQALRMSREYNVSTLLEMKISIFKRVVKKIKSLDIKCFLSLGLATPAIKHDTFATTNIQSIYTSMYNFLNFPAGVLPITKVKENEQYYKSKINDFITRDLDKIMKGSKGLPVGVQVVALPWNDELLIEVMKLIENGVEETFECKFQNIFKKFI